MTTEEITERIKAAPGNEKLDAKLVEYAVADATESVKSYALDNNVLGYAAYLYACHLLFVRVLKRKGRFKSVKAENGEYTKFDGANNDDAWDEFQNLLKEQGYGRNVIKFY